MTSEFKIEKGIPVPTDTGRVGRRKKYPTDSMEPGDSFFVPVTSQAEKHTRRPSLYTAMRKSEKKFPGRKYVLMTLAEGIRVWRME